MSQFSSSGLSNLSFNNISNMQGLAPQSSYMPTSGVNIPNALPIAPPLPPRQHLVTPNYNMISYPNSMYGNYNGFGFGMSGMRYNGGMPYRGTYNGRYTGETQNRFYELAEESSRPAFQSIESIVQTFHNVTMMLESTLNAMQTSFYAVIGVAENFDRLRHLSANIAKYVSALAMMRTIYWFYRRVLYMLGLIRNHPSDDAVWKLVENSIVKSSSNVQDNKVQSLWPIITYFGLLFGGPYIIFKLLSKKKLKENWDPSIHESEEAVVLYGSTAVNEKELTIHPGERLKIPTGEFIKNNSGWIPALNRFNRIGLVPYNYLRQLAQKELPGKNNVKMEENIPNKPVMNNKNTSRDNSSTSKMNNPDFNKTENR